MIYNVMGICAVVVICDVNFLLFYEYSWLDEGAMGYDLKSLPGVWGSMGDCNGIGYWINVAQNSDNVGRCKHAQSTMDFYRRLVHNSQV